MQLRSLPFRRFQRQSPMSYRSATRRRLNMESLERRLVLDCTVGVSLCVVNVSHDITNMDAETTLREAVDAAFVSEIRFSFVGNDTIILTDAAGGSLTVNRPLLIDGTNEIIPPTGSQQRPPGPRVKVAAPDTGGDRVWNVACTGGCEERPSEGFSSGVTILDMEILGNPMPLPGSAAGGGIVVDGSSTLTLDRVTIASGQVTGSGGALLNFGATTVHNSTISGNTAAVNGGGIANYGTLTLVNSTVSGNQAVLGGGVFDSASPSLMILNSTIAGNSADQSGGGLFVATGAPMSLQNSIVGENSASVDGPDLLEATFNPFFASYSLIQSPLGHGILNGVDGNLVGIDPDLGPLANNGGPTYTHLPAAGSAVVDAGNGSRAFDQRNFTGVVGSGLDMGSVEFGGNPLPDGDFNSDTLVNIADIDALVAEIASMGGGPLYDLNGDGLVDLTDLNQWMSLAGDRNLGPGRAYKLGDANLDGYVDGQDFLVWNTYKFTVGGAWSRGDFDADGLTDASDFVIWMSNKFTSSFNRVSLAPRPANAVPDHSLAAVTPHRSIRLRLTSPVRALAVSQPSQTSPPLKVRTHAGHAAAATVRTKSTAQSALSADRVDVAHQLLYDLAGPARR